MGWLHGIAGAILLTTLLPRSVVSAEPLPRYHDSVYLRFGLGLSYFRDAVESEPIPMLGAAKGTIRGIAPTLELAGGGSIIPGLVVGAGMYLHWIPAAVASNAEVGARPVGEDIKFNSSTMTLFGPFVDYYVDPASGFHLQACVGYGILSLGQGKGAKSTALTYVEKQSGGGLATMVAAGYEWWMSDRGSVGILGRLTFGWGTGEDPAGVSWKHQALVPALLLSATLN